MIGLVRLGLCLLMCALCRTGAAGMPTPALDPAKTLTQYVLDNWSPQQGLPQNTVQAIVQTPDGYVWMGTDEGLARFDGARFVVFDKRNTPALRNHMIRSLLVDTAGVLWIGSGGGGLTRYADGEFQAIESAPGIVPAELRALLIDRQGQLWVGGRGSGLLRLDNDRLVNAPGHEGLPSQRIETLLEDGEGGLWVGSATGLFRWRDGVVQPGPLTDTTTVLSLLRDRQGTLWIGAQNGLYRWRSGQLDHFSRADGLSHDLVWTLFEDPAGTLWIGTRGGGLNRLRDGRFTTITRWEGLSHNLVRGFHEDADGSVWIGTDGGGLNRLKEGRISVVRAADGLANDVVYSLAAARGGGLWIGSRGGGLVQMSGDGRIVPASQDPALANAIVMSVQEDAGGLWVATLGSGLKRLVDGRIVASWGRDNGLTDDSIHRVLLDADGSLLIGTGAGGFSVYKDGRFRHYGEADGLSSAFVKAFYRDRQGTLWIGTQGGGLNRLKDGRIQAITTAQGLFDDTVHAILEDDFGHLWTSSNRGIFRAAKADIEAVLDGRQPSLRGTSFGTADGMRNAECNGGSPSGIKTRDGRLWFATMGGAAVVDPARLPRNPLLPPVHVESITANGQVLRATPGLRLPADLRTLEIAYTALSLLVPERVDFRYRLEGFDPAWIDPGRRRTAYFTNLAPGPYRFQVIASNNDGVWNQQGAALAFEVAPHWHQTTWFRGGVVLLVLSLLYGAYRARVAQLRQREQQLQSKVEQRTAELMLANRELVDAQQQLVTQEKMAALGTLTAGVAHEINNPTNFIAGSAQNLGVQMRRFQTFLQQLAGDDADPQVMAAIEHEFKPQYEQLETILDGALRISRIVGDLRQFTRLDEAERKRIRIGEPIQSTLNLVRTRFDQVAFELDLGANPEIECQPAKLGQVFMNLIVNACEATQDCDHAGRVAIVSRVDGPHVVVQIEDNGPGMDEATRQRVFEPFFTTKEVGKGTGLGLSITLGIVREHGGSIEVESKPGQGCRFCVRLPLAAEMHR